MYFNDPLASYRGDDMHLGFADAEGTDDMCWAPADFEGSTSGLTVTPEYLGSGCIRSSAMVLSNYKWASFVMVTLINMLPIAGTEQAPSNSSAD